MAEPRPASSSPFVGSEVVQVALGMDGWDAPMGLAPALMSPAEVVALLDLTGQERETIAQIEHCVGQLGVIRDAKTVVARLSPVELRAGLICRAQPLVARSGRRQ